MGAPLESDPGPERPADLAGEHEGGTSHKIARGKKGAFIAAFIETGRVSTAARIVGVARRTHYDWLANDPEYCEAFAMACEEAVDVLFIEARHRAVDGVERPVLYRGKPILDEDGKPIMIKKYSDRLLMFLMAALKPEVYGNLGR